MVVRRRARGALILLLWLAGCDDAPATDAGIDGGGVADGGIDAGPDGALETDAGPLACDDLSPLATSLVISEVRPGEYIELFNATGSDIDLRSSDHWFCSPFIYVPLADTGGIVPARGYLSIDWPYAVLVSAGMESTGELILYSAGTNFDDPALMLDFMCWGTRPAMSRKVAAEVGGHWAGECASAIPAGGSIHRLAGTDGAGPDSYDTSAPPSRLTCAP